MTKKHYIYLARNIKHLARKLNADERRAIKLAMFECCETFQLENPLFDEQRFLEACGFEKK